MAYKFTITEPAKKETIDAFLWYEKKKNGLGEEFFEELDNLYEFIKSNPNLFPIKRGNIIHEAVVKRFPFVVTYAIEHTEIIILSVFKTPQNPDFKP